MMILTWCLHRRLLNIRRDLQLLHQNGHLIACGALHTTARNDVFQTNRKGRYGYFYYLPWHKKIPLILKEMKSIKGEFLILREEIKEFLKFDPPFVKPGDSDYVWKFDTPQVLEKWNTVSDKDHNEGYSECEFSLNKHNKAVFSGVLNTKIPKDGKIQRAGYCNITSHRVRVTYISKGEEVDALANWWAHNCRKSFNRATYYDWHPYTHLLLRVRGDGRSYMVNLLSEGFFDVTWNDMYSYVLYTRGGPYWQTAKIPFSKFFLSSKGKVQDRQFNLSLGRVSNIGITCSDKVPGPFQLEIDYIGVICDPAHTESFAYEMYELPDKVHY